MSIWFGFSVLHRELILATKKLPVHFLLPIPYPLCLPLNLYHWSSMAIINIFKIVYSVQLPPLLSDTRGKEDSVNLVFIPKGHTSLQSFNIDPPWSCCYPTCPLLTFLATFLLLAGTLRNSSLIVTSTT